MGATEKIIHHVNKVKKQHLAFQNQLFGKLCWNCLHGLWCFSIILVHSLLLEDLEISKGFNLHHQSDENTNPILGNYFLNYFLHCTNYYQLLLFKTLTIEKQRRV